MRRVIGSLLVVLVVLAFGACSSGGGSKPTVNANTNTGDSGSSSQVATGDAGDFCRQLASLDPAEIANDPTGAKSALETFKKLRPPAQIAGQWDDYLKAIEEIANTNSSDDPRLAQIAAAHIQSISAVGLFISQSCLSAFSGGLPSSSDN